MNDTFDYYRESITELTSGIGQGISQPKMGQYSQAMIAQLLGSAQEKKPMPDGSKPVVICRGVVTEAKTMEEAQTLAESVAHQHSADAYILKPVKRVAPKRDVVTTDL